MKKIKQVIEHNITYKPGDNIFDEDKNIYGRITEIWEVDNCVSSGKTYVIIYEPLCDDEGVTFLDATKSVNANFIIPANQRMEQELQELAQKHKEIKQLLEDK